MSNTSSNPSPLLRMRMRRLAWQEGGGRRDRIAWAVCNWMLRHVASDWYENWITGIVVLGWSTFMQDERKRNGRQGTGSDGGDSGLEH